MSGPWFGFPVGFYGTREQKISLKCRENLNNFILETLTVWLWLWLNRSFVKGKMHISMF
jgi:hypothetical protein